MVTCGMYDAAGDWVSAVGMPAKSGVGGGIVAVLPGQLGIGVYSPLLDTKGNSVRGVKVCRSLSHRLGLHFLTVTRESRSTIRSIYDPCERVRVYEFTATCCSPEPSRCCAPLSGRAETLMWRSWRCRGSTTSTTPAAACSPGCVDTDRCGQGRLSRRSRQCGGAADEPGRLRRNRVPHP